MINGEKGIVQNATFVKDKIKKVNGKYFILSAGGIENSRLLLWFRKNNEDLINDNIPIGNYWMDHPYHPVAEGILFNIFTILGLLPVTGSLSLFAIKKGFCHFSKTSR